MSSIRAKINLKIKKLKAELRESTGMGWEEYNRKLLYRPESSINWDDITCRQIVMLNTLRRK